MNAIDFERTLKAPFRDAEWITKALLGLVFVVLGVTFPAVVGAGFVSAAASASAAASRSGGARSKSAGSSKTSCSSASEPVRPAR